MLCTERAAKPPLQTTLRVHAELEQLRAGSKAGQYATHTLVSHATTIVITALRRRALSLQSAQRGLEDWLTQRSNSAAE